MSMIPEDRQARGLYWPRFVDFLAWALAQQPVQVGLSVGGYLYLAGCTGLTADAIPAHLREHLIW